MDIVNYNSSPYSGRVKLATSRLSQVNLEEGELQTEPAATTQTTVTTNQVMTRSESTLSTTSNPTTCIWSITIILLLYHCNSLVCVLYIYYYGLFLTICKNIYQSTIKMLHHFIFVILCHVYLLGMLLCMSPVSSHIYTKYMQFVTRNTHVQNITWNFNINRCPLLMSIIIMYTT